MDATAIPTTLADAPIGVALPPISVPSASVHARTDKSAPDAAAVVLPAIDGEVQILTNHEECVVALKTGEVRIGTPKGEMIPAVCGSGFAEVTSDNQVEILVDTIERPEEIDIRRAKEAKERAEERLLQHKSRMEYYRNTTSLARAMARLKEANKYRH